MQPNIKPSSRLLESNIRGQILLQCINHGQTTLFIFLTHTRRIIVNISAANKLVGNHLRYTWRTGIDRLFNEFAFPINTLRHKHPSQPQSRSENLGKRPGKTHIDSFGIHRLDKLHFRHILFVEIQIAIYIIFNQYDIPIFQEFNHLLFHLHRINDSGRIVKIRTIIQKLRLWSGVFQPYFQLFDIDPLICKRNTHQTSFIGTKSRQGTNKRRIFNQNRITGIDECFGKNMNRLQRTGSHHQAVFLHRQSFLLKVCLKRFQHRWQSVGRTILQRYLFFLVCERTVNFVETIERKKIVARHSTRKRNDIGCRSNAHQIANLRRTEARNTTCKSWHNNLFFL